MASVKSKTGSPLQSTRQMLDELDAMMDAEAGLALRHRRQGTGKTVHGNSPHVTRTRQLPGATARRTLHRASSNRLAIWTRRA